jgi:hypothetical protein
MDKNTLNEAVKACKNETKEALQTFYDELNNGQQKKMANNERVRPILERFGIIERK